MTKPVENPQTAGRPSTYDEKVADRICKHVEETGTGFETACNLEGISESGGRAWKDAHPEFTRAFQKARATKRVLRAEQLDKRCEMGDTVGIIFACKTTGEFNDRAGQEQQKVELEIKGARLVIERDEGSE